MTHLLRLWGIRHIRAIAMTYRINRHYDAWKSAGFLVPGWTEEEHRLVDDIWSGKR
jgi:hypothetical protein